MGVPVKSAFALLLTKVTKPEKIADTLFSESDRWEGTASELCERLAVDIKPNVLSLRLSINASRLFRDYGIRYQNSRTHDGRKVSLWKETEQTA
jgi:hypothetical protein